MPKGADPYITRVQPLRPRGLKVLVHLDDDREPIEIMLETLERARLGVGDALPPTRLHHLLNADADLRVRDAALNLISYRARTRSELAKRLRQKGFQPARIEPCLDRLQEKGFIDDGAVAEAFVRDRIRHRPRGRSRLASELRTKGVDPEVAQSAIDHALEEAELTDLDLAVEVAEGWVRRQSLPLLAALVGREQGPDAAKARRRLYGFLTRRGFRGDALTAAMESSRTAASDRLRGDGTGAPPGGQERS